MPGYIFFILFLMLFIILVILYNKKLTVRVYFLSAILGQFHLIPLYMCTHMYVYYICNLYNYAYTYLSVKRTLK